MKKMIEQEKDHIIELLLEVFEEASDSEGIYFTSNESAIEIMEFEIKLYPERESDLRKRIDYLLKIIASHTFMTEEKVMVGNKTGTIVSAMFTNDKGQQHLVSIDGEVIPVLVSRISHISSAL